MNDSEALALMMADAEGGQWVRCADRQPPKYGRYKIIKRGRSRHMDYDEYLWNGSGWVTHGHSLSNAVEAWWEVDGDAVSDSREGSDTRNR